MNRKGFTLIELLAVILILGVIALIAIPAVNGIVKVSNAKIAEDAAIKYIKELDDINSLSLLNNSDYETISLTDVQDINPHVHIKGYMPTSGEVTYDNSSGLVKMANLCINHVLVRYKNSEVIAEGECDI